MRNSKENAERNRTVLLQQGTVVTLRKGNY
jgi:hypothetical protein